MEIWIVTALLVLVLWTGVGFVTAVLFFQMGFGFGPRHVGVARVVAVRAGRPG